MKRRKHLSKAHKAKISRGLKAANRKRGGRRKRRVARADSVYYGRRGRSG